MRLFNCPTLLLLLFITSSALAEVSTSLEPRLVDEMETVRLTLRVSGSGQLEAPDFSPLEENFELLGTQNSSRISSINGRTSAIVEYQITLRPRRTGQLLVPAIKLGDEYSEPLEVAVRPMDPSIRATIGEMIFFETELSNNPIYVQAQTVLIRRLYYSNGVQIYSDLPGVPELPDAVVVPLGDTRSTTTLRDNKRYGVIEQRFAIFPERSGTLTIPSISVTSSVRLQSGGRTRRSGIRVATDEINVEVLPIPASYPPTEPWLPAEAVTLSANWEPQGETYETGDHIKLQLRAQIIGNVSSSLPPIAMDLPSQQFKVYPEAPALDEDTSGDRVIGYREENFALIPTRPGPVNLPALSLTWWDTQADQLRQALLPPRQLQITGEPPAPEPIEIAAEETSSTPQPQTAERLTLSPLTPQVYVLIGFALLLLLLVAGYRYLPLPALPRLPERLQQPQRKQLKRLTASCHSGDLAQVKHELTHYLSLVFKRPPAVALELFRQLPEAATLLRDLDQRLYSSELQGGMSAADFDSASLLALAKQAGKYKLQPAAQLPSLYS